MITLATTKDIQDIATLYKSSWQNTYKELVPDDYLQSLSTKEIQTKWQLFLADAHTSPNIYLYRDHNQLLLGFIAIKQDRHIGEIYALYVAKEAKGKGIGTLLFQTAMTYFETLRIGQVRIWVMQKNYPAVAFYQHLGGILEQTRTSTFDTYTVIDEAYRFDVFLSNT